MGNGVVGLKVGIGAMRVEGVTSQRSSHNPRGNVAHWSGPSSGCACASSDPCKNGPGGMYARPQAPVSAMWLNLLATGGLGEGLGPSVGMRSGIGFKSRLGSGSPSREPLGVPFLAYTIA